MIELKIYIFNNTKGITIIGREGAKRERSRERAQRAWTKTDLPKK